MTNYPFTRASKTKKKKIASVRTHSKNSELFIILGYLVRVRKRKQHTKYARFLLISLMENHDFVFLK